MTTRLTIINPKRLMTYMYSKLSTAMFGCFKDRSRSSTKPLQIVSHREGGLPIGLAFSHLEFENIENLWNPLFWTSAKPTQRQDPKTKHVKTLYFFCGFVAFLTILANLMGPGSAALVLPRFQWVETRHRPSNVYNGVLLQDPPQGDSALDGCTAAALSANNFSCTYSEYGTSLEQLTAPAIQSTVQNKVGRRLPMPGISQEYLVNLVANGTADGAVIWTPNRQVLRDLSVDALSTLNFAPEQFGKPAASPDDSVELELNREGPSLGFSLLCNAGNVSVTKVAENKEVHCFSRWWDGINDYTKVRSRC